MTIPTYKPGFSSLNGPDAALRRARALLERKRADPASIGYTLEQCKLLVKRAEQVASAPPSFAVSPAVLRLLHAPSTVLADRSQWPTSEHVAHAETEARTAYLRWIKRRAREAGGEWESALKWHAGSGTPMTSHVRALQWLRHHATWPFPVGQDCSELAFDLPAFYARALMPFPAAVYVALVVSTCAGSTELTMFFLAGTEPSFIGMAGERVEAGQILRATGEVRRVVHGDPDAAEICALTTAAREWWTDLAGKPLKRGRGKLKGDVMWTPDLVWDLLVRYKALPVEIKRRTDAKPRLADFLGYIRMHRNTWTDLKKEWGWTWATLRDAVYETPDKPSRESSI